MSEINVKPLSEYISYVLIKSKDQKAKARGTKYWNVIWEILD